MSAPEQGAAGGWIVCDRCGHGPCRCAASPAGGAQSALDYYTNPSPETVERVRRAEAEIARGETVSLDELRAAGGADPGGWTPGPWTVARMVHADNGEPLTPEQVGEYVKNAIIKSTEESGTTDFLFVYCEKPDGPADICHVGNGPTSPANARLIASAPALAAELERVKAERDATVAALHPHGGIPDGDLPSYVAALRAEVERMRAHNDETGALLLESHAAGCKYAAELTAVEAERDALAEALKRAIVDLFVIRRLVEEDPAYRRAEIECSGLIMRIEQALSARATRGKEGGAR